MTLVKARTSTSDLTPSRKISAPRPRLDGNQVLGREYGNYPWDEWERYAEACGVPKELAGLGRAVIREAWQHDWEERLKSLCGWRDDGQRMIKLALRSPKTAEKRWNRLLETDGYRGEWNAETGEWISWR